MGACRLRFATTLVAVALLPYFDLANIVMLFLLTVVLVAWRLGGGPAVLAAFVSVAAFDFFCVPPRLSFAVSDVQYLVTFVVMLAVALIIGQMTAGLRYQARVATYREERSRALYEFARDLSSLLQVGAVVDTVTAIHRADFPRRSGAAGSRRARPAAFPRRSSRRHPVSTSAAAQWAFDNTQPAGLGTDTLAGSEFLYLPLRAPMRTRGVLAIKPESRRLLLVPEQQRQLDTFAALAAIALERVHYVEVAQQALMRMESERLRNSLLVGAVARPADAAVRAGRPRRIAGDDAAPAFRRAARTRAGDRRRGAPDERARQQSPRHGADPERRREARRQWLPFEEVVGSALKSAQAALAATPRRSCARTATCRWSNSTRR